MTLARAWQLSKPHTRIVADKLVVTPQAWLAAGSKSPIIEQRPVLPVHCNSRASGTSFAHFRLRQPPAMRASSPSTSSTLLTLLCLAQSGHASSNYDCTNAVDDRTHWNLGALKGEKSLSWAHPLNPTIRNTTFTFDVCDYLPTKGDRTCEQGTHSTPADATMLSRARQKIALTAC